MDDSEFPADLSSIIQNGIHDDIELECWIVVPIAKKSYSGTNSVSEAMSQGSKGRLKCVFDGYEVL